MDQKFQSSFIPKIQSGGIVARVKRPTTIFYWLSVLIFIFSVGATIWLFVSERFFLSKELREKEAVIETEIKAFDPELSDSLTLIKQRIDSGRELLPKHVSAGKAFTLVKESIVQGINLTNLTFEFTPGGGGSLEAKGESPSYATLNFQSEVFNLSESFLNTTFSGLNLNEMGRVVFSFKADVAPEVIKFSASESSSFLEPKIDTATTTTESLSESSLETTKETIFSEEILEEAEENNNEKTEIKIQSGA